jgi:hypothetical protein
MDIVCIYTVAILRSLAFRLAFVWLGSGLLKGILVRTLVCLFDEKGVGWNRKARMIPA